jgi:UDP-N-acetylglucosamine 2-epimerase
MKIATIIGARPQFIKAAAVSRAIAIHNRDVSRLTPNSSRLTEILIHTGQHYDDDMSAIFFRELEIPEPNYNLEVGSGPHGRQTGRMLAAIEEVLIAEKPDWVLIYGDTNSTLAGALAAAKLHIPIAHVEAGLRSFNRRMPEEINRIVADQLSTLLFCPSQTAVDNLAAEGIGKNEGLYPFFSQKKLGAVPVFSEVTAAEKMGAVPNFQTVALTGDVMADALQFAATKATAQSDILARLGLKPQGYLLATLHRAENTDDPDRLGVIITALSELAAQEPVILPLHPRTKKILERTLNLEPGTLNIEPRTLNLERPSLRFLDPVGYFDIIALEKSARMLLTDSGGMQKEAYWLKVPCVTLRDETEWVETVASGWNILTGADRGRIIDAVRTFKPPAAHTPLYGDGKAATRCLQALLES